MKIMIAGGSGFLGGSLAKSLLKDGHQVFILTRGSPVSAGAQAVQWDARTTAGWGQLVNGMDGIIHLAGRSLSSWPWTAATKQDFYDSRILPGEALARAVQEASRRPGFFIQSSGINHYGLHGDTADEATPAGNDFLAQLTVQWEEATRPVEELGVRRIVIRTSVVLGRGEGILPLMSLPVRLFAGGPLGDGKFCMPWIHVNDWVGAVRFLIDQTDARGAYNLIAPAQTSNAGFMRALAEALHRPYWFPTPAFLLRAVLGEMSVLIVEGRYAQPKRLIEAGYRFQFADAREALADLLTGS